MEHAQIVRFTSETCQEMAPHMMEGQMVAMVLQPGSVAVGLRQQSLTRFDYGPGDLILCRRHTEEWVRWGSPIEMLMARVSDEALQAVAAETGGGSLRLEATPNLQDGRVQALMYALDAERICGFQSGQLYLDSVGQALAAAVANARGTLLKPLRSWRDGLAPVRLRRVVSFVHEHLSHDLSLQQLADIAGLSTAYFSRLFQQSTGLSPHRYVLQARVKRAQELLRQPETRVLDVALACGFQTQQHFARVFREWCGSSPVQYRREFCAGRYGLEEHTRL